MGNEEIGIEYTLKGISIEKIKNITKFQHKRWFANSQSKFQYLANIKAIFYE